MSNPKTMLLNSLQMQQRIDRLAYQVYEDNFDRSEVIVAGIANSGYVMAERLCAALERICKISIRLIRLEVDKETPTQITLTPSLNRNELSGKVIIVVDDVLNSGKTLIYSLRPFLEADTAKIRTVLLVDRDHKRFPVESDFVGITLSTTLQDHIRVDFTPGKEAVYLE